MINSSLATYIESTKSLKFYLNEVQLLRKLSKDFHKNYSTIPEFNIKENINTRLKGHSDTKFKQFEYSSIIVTLYGNLERYLEEVLSEILELYTDTITSYKNLPENIVNNHYRLSADLMKNINLPKYANKITIESVIANMNSCIKDIGYKLNIHAFTSHTANFRIDNIESYFNNIGISGLKSLLIKDFYFLQYANLLEEEVSSFNVLKQVADRRNEIAHGAENIDILDLEILNDYIDYIDHLVLAINRLLICKVVDLLYDKKKLITLLPLSDESSVYFGSQVKGFTITDRNLFKNMEVLMKSNDEYSIVKIDNMRIDEKDYEEIEVRSNKMEVSIKFDRAIKDGTDFYLIPD